MTLVDHQAQVTGRSLGTGHTQVDHQARVTDGSSGMGRHIIRCFMCQDLQFLELHQDILAPDYHSYRGMISLHPASEAVVCNTIAKIGWGYNSLDSSDEKS